MFSCELCEISKNTFFTEHLRWLLLCEICSKLMLIIKTWRHSGGIILSLELMLFGCSDVSIVVLNKYKCQLEWQVKLISHIKLQSFNFTQTRCLPKKGWLLSSKQFLTEAAAGGFQAATLSKKETLAQAFSCEFCKISKNTFFTEHLWATASVLRFDLIKNILKLRLIMI